MISDTCWKNILSDVFSIFLPSSEFVSEIEVCWKDDIKKVFTSSGELLAYLYIFQDKVDYDIYDIKEFHCHLKNEKEFKKDVEYLIQQISDKIKKGE